MYIECYNAETNQYLRKITEQELFEQCGKDQRMYDDFIRHIKKHPYAKPLKEIWKLFE